MKILLAVDGSTCSAKAVNEFARQPWPAASEIKVLSVIETPIVHGVEPWALPSNYFDDLERESLKQARVIVDRALSKLKAAEDESLKVTSEIVEGAPNNAILDVAERWGADLIVVGSRGLGALRRFLLGSVSHSVALHAKCSVEIVRCAPHAGDSAKEV